jgi:putative MFS transporter
MWVDSSIYNASLLGGAVVGLVIVDRVSRRTFLIGSFWAAAAATLLLTVWSPLPVIPMTVLFAVFAGVLSAASNLVYVYLPELFPTTLRASGIGLASAVSRIGSAVSTFLLPVVVSVYGVHVALAACVAVLAAGAASCQIWAPETRDIRLEKLDRSESTLA